MKKHSILFRTGALLTSFVMSFSMTPVVSLANEGEEASLTPPIVANGGNVSYEGNISCDSTDYAVAAINGGTVGIKGDIEYSNTESNSAAVVCSDGTKEQYSRAFIDGDINSQVSGVKLSDYSYACLGGEISAESVGIFADNSLAELNSHDIKESNIGVFASNNSIVHVDGNVNSELVGFVAQRGNEDGKASFVDVQKDVNSKGYGACILDSNGLVGGNLKGEEFGAVIWNSGTLVAKKDVYGKECAIGIDLDDPNADTIIAVEGNMVSPDGYAIKLDVHPPTDVVPEASTQTTAGGQIDYQPVIVMYKANVKDDHLVGVECDPRAPEAEAALIDYIKSNINYIIKTKGNEKAILQNTFTPIEVSIKTEEENPYTYKYNTMKKDDVVNISLNSDYYLKGSEAVTLQKNSDGSYSVFLDTALGGIDLEIIKKAIEEATNEGDAETQESTQSQTNPAPAIIVTTGNAAPVNGGTAPAKTVALRLSEVTPAQMKTAVIDNIASTPSGGTLRVETDAVSCLDKAMLQAFANNGKIDLELIFTYNGKRMRILIPKGTDINSLLDANGYCGYLKLAEVLGFQYL